MTIEIGTIETLMGTAVATASDGSQRTLKIGDSVSQDEVITTGAAGAIAIELADGSLMTLGRDSQAVLDTEVYDPSAAVQATESVDSDVDAIQQALLDGTDPTQVGEATAASAGIQTGGNEGHQSVVVDYIAPELQVTSGFDTTGVTTVISGSGDETVFDFDPTAGITTVLLDEDNLSTQEDLSTAFLALQGAFQSSTGFTATRAAANGINDDAEGDDLAANALTVLSGTLAADFGGNGAGDIVFNAGNTQPTGITSGGEALQYWVSEDGYTLIGYTESEGVAEIIMTAQITDVATGAFQVALYGPVDHADGSTEDNLTIDFGFTVSDFDGDSAQGTLSFNIDDGSPITGETIARVDGNSILLGARDGSAGLDNWGVTPGALTGTVTMNGVTANISFQDNDTNANSKLIIYNNDKVYNGTGSLADNDKDGINRGETLSIAFDKLMQQAEIGVDGLGNDFKTNSSAQAHVTWTAYKEGLEVGSGEIDNPDGKNAGQAGLFKEFTITIPDGFDSIVLGNNSNKNYSNYEVRYIKALNIVDEEGAALTTSADLNIIWGADDNNTGEANRSVAFDLDQPSLKDLTSNGEAVTFSLNEDGTFLTATAGAIDTPVFTVSLSDLESGSFSFTLLDNLGHPTINTEDDLNLEFNFIATDADGDTVSGSFDVIVDARVIEATSTVTAKVEFDGIDATGETADLLIEGTAGADIIFGGAGDDIIFGGDGGDQFVWNAQNIGTDNNVAHDIVEDFDAAEGDVLNLSDLLSNGSYSIEGIGVGAAGSEHLQLNIKDSVGNVVQEIELLGVDPLAALNSLLSTSEPVVI